MNAPAPATMAGFGRASGADDVFAPPASAAAQTRLGRLPIGPLPPISYQQERLVELETRQPEYQRYHRQFAIFGFKGDLDRNALGHALDSVRACHDSLRFRLGMAGGRPYAVFDTDESLPLPEEDLRDRDDDQALAHVCAQAVEPYNLMQGALSRAKLYRLSENTHWLLIAAHHIVFDYWSMGVIVEELGAAYLQGLVGRRDAPAKAALSPADYAVWQRSEGFASIVARQRPFWRDLLRAPVPRSELLFYPLSYASAPYDFAQLRVSVDGELVALLKGFAKANNLTLYMVLLLGFILTLRYFGAVERMMVAAPVSGRTQVELAKLVAFLSGVMPLVFEPRARVKLADFLGEIRRVVTGAIANQDVQFQEFAELAGGELHYQFMFQLQNAPIPDFNLAGLQIRPVRVDYGVEYVDMSLCLTQSPVLSGNDAGISGYLTVNKNLISDAEAARIWEVYLAIARAAVANVERPIDSLLEEIRNASR
jgi:hypothetical protein